MKIDYIALDYGTKKIGLAIGDSATSLVLPKSIIPAQDLADYLQTLLKQYPSVTTFLVSHNTTFRGKSTINSIESEKLAQSLQAQFTSLHVVLYNERGTTAPYGRNSDDKAAAYLLEQYFRFALRKQR